MCPTIIPKEEKKEAPILDEEEQEDLEKVLEGIPDIEKQEEEVFEEHHKTEDFHEATEEEEEQESNYGI